VRSHARAAAATSAGRFKAEIVPIRVDVSDANGRSTTKIVEADEGIRPGTNLQSLSKLKPAFKKGGSTTAGNASQLSDGAALALVMKRSHAEAHSFPILGVLRSFAVVGVDPDIMGVGPADAIPGTHSPANISNSFIYRPSLVTWLLVNC